MLLDHPTAFQNKLLTWYRKNARDLPWRRTNDPYKIWVSEIMLQQTQVDTVIPYYDRWTSRFPDVHSLAKADSDDVMKHWAGLGYYRRARMLHEGAKKIAKDFGGKLPDTPEKLIEIPGIGRYTAGAIASIAFGVQTPVLDGNVIRILTRLTAFADDTGSPKTISTLWNMAETLVGAGLKPAPTHSLFNAGDFNQAMMELGATVCLPKTPQCKTCPAVSLCASYKKGNPLDYPVKLKREKILPMKTAAVILKNRGKILVGRQPSGARWGGLWMFPHGKDKSEILKTLQIAKEDVKRAMTIYHGFTKYKVQLDVYECSSSKNRSADSTENRWVKITELPQLAFPSPHQKILEHILKQHG